MRDDLRAQRNVDRAADIAVVRRGRIAADRIDMDMVGGDFAGNAAVEHIHRAADRLAAEQEHGGAAQDFDALDGQRVRSEEHTSELQSLMRNSYAVFCLKKKTNRKQ